MPAAVDVFAPGAAGVGEFGETAISAAQVRLGGHQVGLGQADGGLHPALGFRVVGHAGLHRAAVVPAGGDYLRVPDGDPGDMVAGDRACVVGQHVRGRAADPPQRRIQAGHQGAQGAVPDRDHHPETGPGQPGAPQPRPPPANARPLAPVELQPHARLGDPRPVGAPPAGLPGGLGRVHRPPGRTRRAAVAHRGQLVVRDISADLGFRRLHPFLDLLQERVDQLRPGRPLMRVESQIPQFNIPFHGLGISTGQLRGRPDRPGQVVCLKDLHDLPVRLGHGTSSVGLRNAANISKPVRRGLPERGRRSGHPRPSTRNFRGHQPGLNWPPIRSLPWPSARMQAPTCENCPAGARMQAPPCEHSRAGISVRTSTHGHQQAASPADTNARGAAFGTFVGAPACGNPVRAPACRHSHAGTG